MRNAWHPGLDHKCPRSLDLISLAVTVNTSYVGHRTYTRTRQEKQTPLLFLHRTEREERKQGGRDKIVGLVNVNNDKKQANNMIKLYYFEQLIYL